MEAFEILVISHVAHGNQFDSDMLHNLLTIKLKTMNRIELKPNIILEGFDDKREFDMKLHYLTFNAPLPHREGKVIPVLYEGKTSKMSEELAKELVDTIPHIFYGKRVVDTDGNDVLFKNYKINKFAKRSGKRSIQSACQNEFCIIYKTN
jgi:hypothetical protein